MTKDILVYTKAEFIKALENAKLPVSIVFNDTEYYIPSKKKYTK